MLVGAQERGRDVVLEKGREVGGRFGRLGGGGDG